MTDQLARAAAAAERALRQRMVDRARDAGEARQVVWVHEVDACRTA